MSLFYGGDFKKDKKCEDYEGYAPKAVYFATKTEGLQYFSDDSSRFSDSWTEVEPSLPGSSRTPTTVNCKNMNTLMFCMEFEKIDQDSVSSSRYRCIEKRIIDFPERKVDEGDLLFLSDLVKFYTCDSLKKGSNSFRKALTNADIEEGKLFSSKLKEIAFSEKFD